MPQSFTGDEENMRESYESLLLSHRLNSKSKDFDVVEATIGNIGRWQLKIYMLMFVVFAPSSWVELGIELFAHQTDFWCIPPDEVDNKESQKLENTTYNGGNLNVCNIQNDSNTPCLYGYKYNTSLVGTTIISEWDLVCDREYIISVIQIMIMFGSLVGGIVFGIAADKYGRRVTLFVSCFLRFFCGMLSAFATDVLSFTILRFILAFFDGGVPAISLMMCVEVLGGRWRVLLGILLQIGFSVGFPIMALVTYAFKNWRHAQLALSLISLLSAICAWIAPESPRWLLAVGKKHQAVNVLEKAAKENKRNSFVVRKTVWEFDNKNRESNKPCFWWFLFKTPQLRSRTFLACINGAVVFMLTNGFYQYFGEFSNNPFFDLSLQGGSAIVGAIIAAAIVTRYSRRRTLAFMSFIISACSCIILWFSDSIDIRSILSAIILCALGVTVSVIEPLIGELFPTILRNSGFGVFSIFAGIGTMIAPIVILLGNLYWYLPLATFCFLALTEIVLVLLLPESLHEKLAETVEDIEC